MPVLCHRSGISAAPWTCPAAHRGLRGRGMIPPKRGQWCLLCCPAAPLLPAADRAPPRLLALMESGTCAALASVCTSSSRVIALLPSFISKFSGRNHRDLAFPAPSPLSACYQHLTERPLLSDKLRLERCWEWNLE